MFLWVDALAPGDPGSVGGYRLLGRLGGGGMGQVFLGVSPGGRRVAVKLIHPALAGTGQFRERFAREIEAARRVGGFHTASVVDADPLADPPWMVTAYIEGPSLEAAVARDGPMPPDGVRAAGAGLAEGLAAIHAHGLVHRDLKPGNVILAEDGPRIIDFGIARAVDGTGLTTAGSVIGTCAYMSPEQIRGEAAGPYSDVFALGCVLAFAATGRPPFTGETAATVIYRILSQPPDLGGLPGGDLHQLIASCLAKSPQERPGVHAILAALGGAAPGGAAPGRGAGLGVAAGAPSGVAPSAEGADTSTHPPLRVPVPTGSGRPPGLGPPPLPTGSGRPPGLGPPPPPGLGQAAAGYGAAENGASPRRRARRRTAALVTVTAVLAAVATAVPILLSTGTPRATARHQLTGPTASPLASASITQARAADPTVTPTRSPAATPSMSSPGTHPRVTSQIPAGGLTLHAQGNVLIFGAAFSPDGKLLAAGDDTSGRADLWNTATGALTATLTDQFKESSGDVAFSPDGTLLATANGSSGADLWNVASGTLVTRITQPGYVYGVAFSPDGTLLATANGNTHAYLWDVATRKLVATFKDPDPGGLSTATFSPDGKLLLTADGNGDAYVFNVASGSRVATLADPGGRGVSEAWFSPDGRLVVTGDLNAHAYVWNAATSTLVATLTNPGQHAAVNGVQFSPDGTLLATADDNRHTYLWNVATYQLAATFTDPGNAQDLSVTFSPDGKFLAIGDENGNIYVRAVSQLTG